MSSAPVPDDGGVARPPLTARSVLLSVLLGSHPPALAVRSLVRTAEMFGISEGTARVALSRLAADGDVVAEDGVYRLSGRLLQRQLHQDEALQPVTRPWRGGWELAVAIPDIAAAPDRALLGADLARLRYGELRPGVWARPDNLVVGWPASVVARAWRFGARAEFAAPSPAELAAQLWDLDGWAETGRQLLDALATQKEPPERFVAAAAVIRHLRDDPLLPQALLPARWPGIRLRHAYESYRRELGRLLERERAR